MRLRVFSWEGKKRRYAKKNCIEISGGDSEGDPPVPIPNTAVKPFSAESTWLVTAREDRTSPDANFKRLLQ